MTNARHPLPSAAAALALAALLIPALPGSGAAQQTTEIPVLVPPVTAAEGLDRDFGKDIAEKVREALEDFAGFQPIDWGDVEDLLDQYDLDEERLTPIEWRQLAGRMNAGMVMLGSMTRAGDGVRIEVAFVDPKTGDELPVDAFTVGEGRDEEAAEAITAGLNEGVEYTRSLAFCSEYLASEQHEDALRNCERALSINPGSTRALYLRGRIHMAMEDWSSAVADLGQVLEENPSNTDAIQSLAYSHLQAGDKERSLELYREYLNFNPDDATVRLNIAYELANGGNYAGAMELLQEGVERAPDNADLWEYLGSVALRKGTEGDGGSEISDPEAVRTAAAAFDRVLELRGDQTAPTILSNVISAHMLLGDYQAALDFSQRAIELIENPPATGVDEGEDPEAEEAPELSKEQLLASIHSKRADVYNRMERFEDAAREVTRAMELDPELPNVYVRRGLYRLKAGDTEAAVADFRTAVNERGADPDQIAQTLFSQAYNEQFQQGRYQPAIRAFETALEFARAQDVVHQIQFFAAYGYYQIGTSLDNQNQQETCQPARRALSAFQNVLPHLNQAGSYQANSQGQIREAVDVQLYRQEQIIRKACS